MRSEFSIERIGNNLYMDFGPHLRFFGFEGFRIWDFFKKHEYSFWFNSSLEFSKGVYIFGFKFVPKNSILFKFKTWLWMRKHTIPDPCPEWHNYGIADDFVNGGKRVFHRGSFITVGRETFEKVKQRQTYLHRKEKLLRFLRIIK